MLQFRKSLKKTKKVRTYIVPTRFGFMLLLLFVFMLLVGSLYSNNMVLGLAFLLFGLGNISMIRTNNHLKRFKLAAIQVDSGFCDDHSTVHVKLEKNLNTNFQNLNLKLGNANLSLETITKDESLAKGFIKLKSRGFKKIQKVKVNSVYPYGLFVAWQWHTCPVSYYVYPKPEGEKVQKNRHSAANDGDNFSGIRPFAFGDTLHRVHWKSLAKGRGHLVKVFGNDNARILDLDIEAIEHDQTEKKLSQLALWIKEAFENRRIYSLHLGHKRVAAGEGTEHYHRCLRELALYKETD